MTKYIPYPRKELGRQRGLGEPDGFTSRVTIESLPDDVLLEIFSFYRWAVVRFGDCTWDWQTLAHVCSRWRHIIFASSHRHRLDPRLICTERTPVIEMLGIFPPFPIVINNRYNALPLDPTSHGWENTVTALWHRDRTCWISLSDLTGPLLEIFIAVMQEPYPELTFLELSSNNEVNEVVPALPDSFLGGYAPRLQYLILRGISFPALLNILFTASNLVSLHLADIPVTGYISPEALAIGLAALPRLTWLIIMFTSPTPPPDRRGQRRLLPIRAVLPSLTFLSFCGVSEYLGDLVARINAPSLSLVDAQFFDQLTLDASQLFRFICRSKKLRSPNRATVSFYGDLAKIVFGPREAMVGPRHFSLRILRGGGSNRQLSAVAQMCRQALPLVSQVERLDIKGGACLPPDWHEEDTNGTRWLELLLPFVSVGRLHISERLGPLVVQALQELSGAGPTAVLPALHSLFLEGLLPSVSVREAIDPFIAARHLSGRSVAVRWGEQVWY